jgi:Fur family transcriptional regulator, ferric uptake regulator
VGAPPGPPHPADPDPGNPTGSPTGEKVESRIERLCVERGLKMTGQRRVIARVLSEASDHPDVEELYRRASRLDARISIATVYRTVRLLEERGILERRDFGGGRARYEPTEHGHHYHLIDIDTGKVVEFQEPEHERLLAEVADRLGFDLVSLRLELFGRRRAAATPEPRRPAGAARAAGAGEGEAAGALAAAPPRLPR